MSTVTSATTAGRGGADPRRPRARAGGAAARPTIGPCRGTPDRSARRWPISCWPLGTGRADDQRGVGDPGPRRAPGAAGAPPGRRRRHRAAAAARVRRAGPPPARRPPVSPSWSAQVRRPPVWSPVSNRLTDELVNTHGVLHPPRGRAAGPRRAGSRATCRAACRPRSGGGPPRWPGWRCAGSRPTLRAGARVRRALRRPRWRAAAGGGGPGRVGAVPLRPAAGGPGPGGRAGGRGAAAARRQPGHVTVCTETATPAPVISRAQRSAPIPAPVRFAAPPAPAARHEWERPCGSSRSRRCGSPPSPPGGTTATDQVAGESVEWARYVRSDQYRSPAAAGRRRRAGRAGLSGRPGGPSCGCSPT